MKYVPAGRKNQKVTLYKPIIGKSLSGAPIKNKFTRVSSPWASVVSKQQSEQEAGDSLQSKITYSIVISWREISPNWAILWRGQLLKVVNIDDSDSTRRQKIILATTENGISEADFMENSIVDGAISDLYTTVNGAWE